MLMKKKKIKDSWGESLLLQGEMRIMRKSVCINWFEKYLKEVSSGRGYWSHINPAIEFVRDAKAGEYDDMTDSEYNALLKETEEISAFWLLQKNQTASDLLRISLEKIDIDGEKLHKLAEILAECYADSVSPFIAENEIPDHKKNSDRDRKIKDWISGDEVNDEKKESYFSRNLDSEKLTRNKAWNPKQIYTYLSDRIYGQKEAVKAATMLLYNHMKGRKRNLLFAGPTGCGKTEIWRVLKQLYPYIQIIDSTAITMEGWSGSFKIKDIFKGMSQEEAEKSIIVFDEFDKFCEPKISAGGTNYSTVSQNELLHLIEGGRVVLESERGKPKIEIDSSKISFVFCGSFEQLTESKTEKETCDSIGFVRKIKISEAYSQYENKISPEDLVKHAGVRQEIVGRINQIVQLYPMTADDYYVILHNKQISPLYQLERQYGVKLHLDSKVRQKLVMEAEKNHMGVRYLRSRIQQMLDEQMFQNCEKTEYQLIE